MQTAVARAGTKRAAARLEPAPESEPTIDALWQMADACLAEYMPSMNSPPPQDLDSDDEEGAAARSTVNPCVTCLLPCGTVHVCGHGRNCPYAVPNEDRELVCMYTGVVVGKERTDEFFDLNGGTGKRSGDPDQCCGQALHSRWKRRANPHAASLSARNEAEGVDSDDEVEAWDAAAAKEAMLVATAAAAQPLVSRSGKRGARCVGDPDDASARTANSKCARLSKKHLERGQSAEMLAGEAEQVLGSLINYDRSSSYKQKRKNGRADRQRPPPDPRMCDEAFVFSASVRKYVKSCLVRGAVPSMDALHNLSLMARRVSSEARAKAQAMDVDALRTVKFRTACSELIVSLWRAACATPYMKVAKRGTDAYRPFVCGCIYGFKRGVTLADGSVLIPTCPALANALPALRGTGGNQLAKTLHSSSHRGVCTLSRCIASVPREEQADVFDAVVRKARQFAASTFKATDI